MSDGAGCFRGRFQDFCKGLHIEPHLTSAYRSPSNGNAERTIGQIRCATECINSLNQKTLLNIIFSMNTSPAQDGSGSPPSRFFGRGLHTHLPNSVDKEVNRRDIIKLSADKQMKLYLHKGRTSRDHFAIGDRVRVKDPFSKLWKDKGQISEAHSTGTESLPSSFVVEFDSGHTGIRHKSYLRHDKIHEEVIKKDSNDATRGAGKLVQFADEAVTGPLTRSKAKGLASESRQ